MSALRDIIQRAIESVSNDVHQWHQKPIVEIAQAVHDAILPELSEASQEILAELEEARTRIEELEKELEACFEDDGESDSKVTEPKAKKSTSKKK